MTDFPVSAPVGDVARPSQRFIDMVEAHCKAEVVGDLDTVISTLCDQPHLEVQPIGFIMTDLDTIRDYYSRLLFMFDKIKVAGDSGTFGTAHAGKYLAEAGIVTRDFGSFEDENGRRLPVKSLALFAMDEASGLLKGETVFLNQYGADLFRRSLGEDFLALPTLQWD